MLSAIYVHMTEQSRTSVYLGLRCAAFLRRIDTRDDRQAFDATINDLVG